MATLAKKKGPNKPRLSKKSTYKYSPFAAILYYNVVDTKQETLLENIAKKHGGKLIATGYGPEGREYSFDFNKESDIKTFLGYVKTIRRPRKIEVKRIRVGKIVSYIDITGKFPFRQG